MLLVGSIGNSDIDSPAGKDSLVQHMPTAEQDTRVVIAIIALGILEEHIRHLRRNWECRLCLFGSHILRREALAAGVDRSLGCKCSNLAVYRVQGISEIADAASRRDVLKRLVGMFDTRHSGSGAGMDSGRTVGTPLRCISKTVQVLNKLCEEGPFDSVDDGSRWRRYLQTSLYAFSMLYCHGNKALFVAAAEQL